MKLIKYLAVASALIVSSHAASVSIASSFGLGVIDSNGAIPNGTGSLSIGYFGSIADGNLATTDAATLAGDFQVFGGGTSTFGQSGLDAFFSVAGDAGLIDNTNPFVGNNIYLLAFNADQSEMMIVKWAETFEFDAAPPTPPSSQNLSLAGGTLLVGTAEGTTGAPVNASAYTMAAVVPEPSVALLGALGVLGLLRRRR